MFNKIIKILLNRKFILFFLLLNSLYNSVQNIGYAKSSSIENINSLQNIDINESDYLLDFGDSLKIEFKNLPFFSGIYSLNIDGYINMPEINRVKAKGFTLYELEEVLLQKFDEVVINPDISVEIVNYRNLNIYISGEVKRPGLYKLNYKKINDPIPSLKLESPEGMIYDSISIQNPFEAQVSAPVFSQPRVFDAIQKASGISNYADLSNITIVRRNPDSKGGGHKKATIDILNLLVNGDINQNLPLYDGDAIHIPRSKNLVKDQILVGANSNLNPSQIRVFITGNVVSSGTATLNNGTSLVQAIASAGGKKNFTGQIEFIRFESNGNAIKNAFKYEKNAPINSSKNPILMDGDIINVKKTIIGRATEFIEETASPIVTSYGIYKIFD